MKKFPKLEIGLRGTARQMFRTVELAGQERDDHAAPVVQFVADYREGVEPEALARLFAASPEMFEALLSVLVEGHHSDDCAHVLNGEICDCCLGRVRMAIAKVEGK